MRPFLFFSIFLLGGFSPLAAQSVDELGVTVSGPGRQFVFTNKEAGTYHGEVSGPNVGGWQGWFVQAEKIVHDYSLHKNGSPLDRSAATTTVFPHALVRKYRNGITETVSFADSLNALIVIVSDPSVELHLLPTEIFSRNGDVWTRPTSSQSFLTTTIALSARRNARQIVFAAAADTAAALARTHAAAVAAQPETYISRRKARMQRLLDLSRTSTNDPELTAAIGWAKLQADALVMNQATGGERTKGIFAGLPWFNNYWGRDSFISLPGITYVIGNFADARDVLRAYAKFQQRDSTDDNYGRIPNLATPQSVIYNTADGTPWFVKSLYEYVKYSGDIDFVKEMYPVIARSIDGTVKFHTDSLGFLTHGDAESWMDAVGPNGPWSPRGNRAVDIQALWHHQLMIGVFCAEYFNDFHSAARWKRLADNVERNFRKYFVDTTRQLLVDHLNRDGSPSAEIRPNQLFAFDMTIPEDVRLSMTRTVLSELVFEHGTATLTQSDSNFFPFHEYPPYYVKDAAYHNGTVWTWLNGASIYAATRYDLQDVVFPVTRNSVRQMLHRGTVGALSELLDAHPRSGEGEPRLSGTYSQAWSLAEFIRTIYQDYFGVSVDLPSGIIRIQPKLPEGLTDVRFTQQVGPGSVTISYQRTGDRVSVSVAPAGLPKKFAIDYLWVYGNGDAVIAPVDLPADTTVTLHHTGTTLTVVYGTKTVVERKNDPRIFLKNFSGKKYFSTVSLARPDTGRSFRVLRGPSHPLLNNLEIKRNNPKAMPLFTAIDPAGDDRGPSGTFEYPSGRHFVPGILDITRAEFSYDTSNLYCRLSFSQLNDPGWHPEYGFQLTLAAITINTGKGVQREIGQNSNARVDSLHSFDRMIVVGGGIRILSGEGDVLAEYLPRPEDVSAPLGNIRSKTIEFALPLRYLGAPHHGWKIAVFIGAQDDHGGAGIGEFRAVGKERSEWTGGGKNNPNDSNVYDVMIVN